jgi:hypothetical protein
MVTVCIQIGNSDDKLSQREWSEFVSEMDDIVVEVSDTVHFCATSAGNKPWQNACWVFEIPGTSVLRVQDRLKVVSDKHHQDELAWLSGNVQFL